MAEVVARFAVLADTYVTVELDTTDPIEVARYLMEEVPVDVSLCHQCAHSVVNPDVGEMYGFSVDDVDYELVGPPPGQWVAVSYG